MENENPVQPLSNPGEQTQPSVLERVLGRTTTAAETNEPQGNIFVGEDNVMKPELTKCINPSCSSNGGELKDGVCTTCGFNERSRY